MARLPKETDFTVQVEGVGTFTFGRRTMGDEIKIQVEYARIIDGVVPTEWLQLVAGWISTLRVLTVRGPEGWDIDALDPLDAESYAKLRDVHSALVAKEQSFRGKHEGHSKGTSEGAA